MKKRTQKLDSKEQQSNQQLWQCIIADRHIKILEIARHLTKNISDAQDIAQTAILRLLTYSPNPLLIINLDAYIYASIRNAARDSQHPKNEVSLSSELKKKDAAKMTVLDPNISKFLETQDKKALVGKTQSDKLKLTMKLIAAGYSLPDIALLLNEPVRSTRYRWYRYRDKQKKALQLISKNIGAI